MSRSLPVLDAMESDVESVRSITEDMKQGNYSRTWLWRNLARRNLHLKKPGYEKITEILQSAAQSTDFIDEHARQFYLGYLQIVKDKDSDTKANTKALYHLKRALDPKHPNFAMCFHLIVEIEWLDVDPEEYIPFMQDKEKKMLPAATAGNTPAMVMTAFYQFSLWRYTQQPQHLKNAREWLIKACKRHDSDAWGLLAKIHAQCNELDQARNAADRAMFQGELTTMGLRGYLYVSHPEEDSDLQAGIELLRQCVAMGNTESMLVLAGVYLNHPSSEVSVIEALTCLCDESILSARDESEELEALFSSEQAVLQSDAVINTLLGYLKQGVVVPADEAKRHLFRGLERLANQYASEKMYAEALHYYLLTFDASFGAHDHRQICEKLDGIETQLQACAAHNIEAICDKALQLLNQYQMHWSGSSIGPPAGIQRLLSRYVNAIRGSVTKLVNFQQSALPETWKSIIAETSGIQSLADHIAQLKQDRANALRVVCYAPRMVLQCPSQLVPSILSFLTSDQTILGEARDEFVSRHRLLAARSAERVIEQKQEDVEHPARP